MKNLIEKENLKIKFRKNFLMLIIPFLIGITIPTIPYLLNNISNWKIKRLEMRENKNLIIRLEEKCKSENKKYKKLQNFGFEKFAIEEFNKCLKENLEKQKEIIF